MTAARGSCGRAPRLVRVSAWTATPRCSRARSAGDVVLVDWIGAGMGPRVAGLGVMLSSVGVAGAAAVAEGYAKHVRLEPEELGRLGDAVRFRPLALGVRDHALDGWLHADEIAD